MGHKRNVVQVDRSFRGSKTDLIIGQGDWARQATGAVNMNMGLYWGYIGIMEKNNPNYHNVIGFRELHRHEIADFICGS